jgi:hypothetical protein
MTMKVEFAFPTRCHVCGREIDGPMVGHIIRIGNFIETDDGPAMMIEHGTPAFKAVAYHEACLPSD